MRLLLCTVASLSLISCVAEVDQLDEGSLDEETSELTLPPTPPPVMLSSHNRMLWRDLNGNNGELWLVNDRGSVNIKTPLTFSNREVLGVAGNRVLWRNGGNAEMRSFDDNGVLGTTVFPITNPNAGRFVPRSISLATNACWSPSVQNYYILWDDTANDEVAIQLVDQAGAQRRVDFVRKPLNNMPALWFCIAADGYEELMLRSGLSTGFLFRVSWSSAVPTGWVVTPTAKAAKSRTGHQPVNTGRVVSSFTFWPGTFDQVLFTQLSSGSPTNNAVLELYQPTTGMPPLLNTVLSGSPPIVYTYTGPIGQFAYAFTGNPKTCN